MEDFFIIMVLVSLLATFVCLLCFIIKWIMRKPKKRWGIAALVSFVLIWVFSFSAVAVSCKGEYKEISRTEPTCTTPGEIVYQCEECGKTKSEKIEPTGHTLVEISRTEPTAETEGKVVERCSVCGEEVTTTLKKLSSSNDKQDNENPTSTEEIIGEETNQQIAEISSDNFAEKLVSFGFTEEEAAENAEILRRCGIPTIDICEPTSDNSLDSVVAFRGKLDDDRIFIFTVDNRKIFYVALNGEDLYDAENGGYLKNFNDVHIPEKSVSVEVFNSLRDRSETVLDQYFRTPRYYDAWAVGREDDNYMMYCQASDGSLLTDHWYSCRVWYEQQENGEFITTGVQINGKYYKLND